jgi:hypothetical protein
MRSVWELMRSPALEIDSIVRGKLRQIAADRGGLRQFAAVRDKKRQFPALSGKPLGARRFPAEPGDIRRRRRYEPTAGRLLNREGF